MRLITPLLFIALAAPAFAADEAQDNAHNNNIFNADISYPDLALSVKAFEEVCMPFVLHKSETELRIDKAHFNSRLSAQGFDFQSSERLKKRYKIKAAKPKWKPDDKFDGGRVNTTTRGQFTVFNGVSNQVVETTGTIVPPSGTHGVLFTPTKLRTQYSDTETYRYHDNTNLTAQLDWKVPTEYHPGKFCEISLGNPEITQVEFENSFIEQDTDWKKDSSQSYNPSDDWYQCVKEEEKNGTAEFLFIVSHQPESLKLSLQRDDIYELSLCGK